MDAVQPDNDGLETTSDATVNSDQRSWLVRRLSNENPFYLLSAAFVIHGTGLSIGSDVPLKMLLSLVGGYLLLLTMIAWGIVRFWQVWDDARSIFMILILLMLELAICFDQSIAQQQAGAVSSLIAVTIASLLVAESIIRLLNIRLPAIYRIPFYIQLSLAMLASLIPMSFSDLESPSLVRWAIYAVSLLAGLSMLTLIPAIQTSRNRVERDGCPWVWPIHPWSAFVIVWCCLGFRLYLLTIAFDPVIELSSAAAYDGMGGIFGGVLLAPMLLGLSSLFVVGAAVHRHWLLHFLALGLPLCAIALSVRPWDANLALANFYREYTQLFGSPLWTATISTLAVSLIAWSLRLPFARRCCVVSTLLLSRITPTTFDAQTLGPVNFYWLSAVVVILSIVGFRRGQSRFVLEAGVWLSVGLHLEGSQLHQIVSPWGPIETQFHLLLVAIVALSFLFRDALMEELRVLLVWALIIASVRLVLIVTLGGQPPGLASADLLFMSLLSLLMARYFKKSGFTETAVFCFSCTYLSSLIEGGRFLTEHVAWSGLKQFLIGLGLLQLGVFASAWKGGVLKEWKKAWQARTGQQPESVS